MGRLDANQFWQSMEIWNVAGCKGTGGDQVIESPTYVDHHLAGWCFLMTIPGQLWHQNLHHISSCKDRKCERCAFVPTWTWLQQKERYSATYPCGLCWSSAWLDFSVGPSAPSAPCHWWCLKDPVGWAASSPAPAPHRSPLTPTWTQDGRSHQLSYYCNLKKGNSRMLTVMVEGLTRVSPAVIFCKAPTAASRPEELLSLLRRTSLYSPTTLGCQSHSAPLGWRETSDIMDNFSWRCHGRGRRKLQ